MAEDWNPRHLPIVEIVPGYITVYYVANKPEKLSFAPGLITDTSEIQWQQRVSRVDLFGFAYGSVSIQTAHQAFLDAKVVPRVLEEGLNVFVHGFAGDKNTAQRRAYAVYDFFVNQRDVDESAVGYLGTAIGVVGTTGRAVDRRVILSLLNPNGAEVTAQ